MFLTAILQASSPMPTTRPLTQVLSIALVLALPTALILIWLYRRAVIKSMRRSSSLTDQIETPLTLPSQQNALAAPQFAIVNAGSSAPPKSEAAALFADVLYAPWRTAAIYATAGMCYAILLTAGTPGLDEPEVPLSIVVLWLWLYFWPFVLIVNLVAAATRLAKLVIVVVYFLILAAIIIMTPQSEDEVWPMIITWAVANLPMTLLLLTFANRRVRAVGPLVLTLLVFEALGLRIAFAILGSYRSSELSDAKVLGLLLIGLLIPLPLGLLLLTRIRRKYERKKISDQSIMIDAVLLVFSLAYSLALTATGPLGILYVLLALFAFKRIAWSALSGRAAMRRTKRAHRLLLLRVFSRRRRSMRLLSGLATHWRHVGSIDLMAGPDLATSTVEPHEFLDFASGKLARRFIDGPGALKRRYSEIDIRPDRDGRYRVNNFFCHADTWKMVLTKLVKETDVVVMDLRGFTSQNEGCIHEISELINTAPLERVVFIIETKGDEELVLKTIRESWRRMEPTSPNFRSAYSRLQFFQFSRERGFGLRELLCALCVAACPTAGEIAAS